MEINRHAVRPLLASLCRDVESRLGSATSRPVYDEHFVHHYILFVDTLCTYVESRGPRVLLVDLPNLGKEYDKGLSSNFNWGYLTRSEFRPKRLVTLIRDSFDSRGCPHDDLDAEKVFLMRQLLYFFKKYSIDCPTTKVEEAVNEFVKIDQGLREPSGSWYSDHWIPGTRGFLGDPDLSGSHPRAAKLWRTVDHVFRSIVPMYEVDRLRIHPKHGPGAVADVRTGGDKYSFPYWPSKLEGTFPFTMFGEHWEGLHVYEGLRLPSEIEPAARLIAVPKTFSGPRLIASEPTAHQFLQQGLMQWLRQNLSPLLRNSIDFSSQEMSRSAALLGSLTGDLATVDLSSASDRLSCWTVERALASNQSLLRCLHAVRTRYIIDATGSQPELSLRMRKFAAQGSAVTFPVQTIIYAGLAIAACLFYENLHPTRRNIRGVAGRIVVFGDDIIMPKSSVPLYTLMLDSLQLKVNGHKTHTSGHFRESCGMDAWRGSDVTPCYLKTLAWTKSPEDISSWYDVCNNAFKKGLWNVSTYMEQQIPKSFRKKAVTTRADGDGLRLFTFCRGISTQAQCRYSQHLHRQEARVFSIRTQVRKKSRGDWNDFYQWLVESPDPQSKWVHGYVTSKTSRISEVWVPIEFD